MPSYWLMKSEPSVFSFEDLCKCPGKTSGWDGVRNYQARNFMQSMKCGDRAFFYHSNADPTGVAGTLEIVRTAYPDPTQYEKKGGKFEPRATTGKPVWFHVDIRALAAVNNFVTLDEMRAKRGLCEMALFKMSRLSVQPVRPKEWALILGMAGLK